MSKQTRDQKQSKKNKNTKEHVDLFVGGIYDHSIQRLLLVSLFEQWHPGFGLAFPTLLDVKYQFVELSIRSNNNDGIVREETANRGAFWSSEPCKTPFRIEIRGKHRSQQCHPGFAIFRLIVMWRIPIRCRRLNSRGL